MKIAVLGASGRAGSEIAREAARRGHDVIAVARHSEKIPAAEGIAAVAADAADPAALAGVIAGRDAVISALHFDVPAETLLTAVRQAGVQRLLEVADVVRRLQPLARQDAWSRTSVRRLTQELDRLSAMLGL